MSPLLGVSIIVKSEAGRYGKTDSPQMTNAARSANLPGNDFTGSLIIKGSAALLILLIIALLVYLLVTPGLAQNNAIGVTGDGEIDLYQIPADVDKGSGTASLSVPAADGKSTLSMQSAIESPDNDTNYNLLYGRTFNLLNHLMVGQPLTISPLARGLIPIPMGLNGAAFHGPVGNGVTASSTDVQTADDSGAVGSSRYIVVFEDASPMALQMAKEQVKGFTESQDGKVIHDYSIIDGLAVSITDNKAYELSYLDNVKYVEKDQLAYADLDNAVPQVGANQVWDLGYDGTGVKVCVIDTGIDAGHPDLNNGKVVAWVDYVKSIGTPYDDNGHGTHVSGIIAGTGSASSQQYKGVAPGASLMGAKVLSSGGSGRYTDILAAINWAVTNHAQVISMSLGGQHSQALDDAVNNAIRQGVVVVVSAGNSGPGARTLSCPGDIRDAITVGAVDSSDVIAYFSSRGPSSSGYFKPDVTAPGVGIVAARASGTVSNYYTAKSGTSMAAPMVSGTVALLLDKNASLTPGQVKDALTKTAKPLGYGIPNNDYGYGRVQAKAAIDYVTNGSTTPSPTPSPTLTPGLDRVPSVMWSNAYQGYSYDLGVSVQPVRDGGFIATGGSYQQGSLDIYLVKTSASGHLLWNRTFGGPQEDRGNAVNQTADGGYIVVGSTWPYGQGGESICLVKTDHAGNIEWNRTYNEYSSSASYDVLQTADGGFIVIGGALVSGPGYVDVYMMKVDNLGNFLWGHTFGGSGYDSGYSVQQTGDGGFIIAGTRSSDTNYTTYAYLIRTDSLGNQLWNNTYRSDVADYTYGNSVRLTNDGGFVVAGTATISTNSDVYVLKTDGTGNKQWDRTYNASAGSHDYGGGIQQTGDGNYIIAGSSTPQNGYGNVYLFKIDNQGVPLWQKLLSSGAYTTDGQSIALSADDGFIICGDRYGYTDSLFGIDLYLLKTNASGAVQWSNAYGERSTDTCTWAQPTSDGGYILTGTTDFRNMGYDMSLVKVDASGKEVWRNAYGGNYNDFGSMVLQTPDGGYVVAGSMQNYSTGYSEASLIKASSAGEWLLQNVYGNSSDSWANALSPTNDGGYVLAGGKYDPALGDCDAYLVKTNASGYEQWEYRYGGNKDDWANSVLQTADGGYLLVGGTYSDGTGNCDVYVKKVSSNGASQWGYYYYTDSSVWGNSVLPTADGGYIITGGARYNKSETKIFLIKIDGSGNILWYHYYGDASYQEGLSIQPANDGSYLIGGTCYDDVNMTYRMELMKIDTTGYPLWAGVYGQYGNCYGYYAQQTGDGGYILAGTTFFRNNTQANLIKMGAVAGPQSHRPIQQISPYNMTSTAGLNVAGGITGRVTTFNTTIGVANTDVWIVNASDTSQYFWHTTTNAQGFFQLTSVNNTFVDAGWFAANPGRGAPYGYTGPDYYPMYKAYCYDDTFGESYSNNFSVESGSNAWTAIVIMPKPSHISLSSSGSTIIADHFDHVSVSAYVTDALNNAVTDNTPVTFWVNEPGWAGICNGSLGHGEVNDQLQSKTVGTINGYANVSFGWVDITYPGCVSHINATCYGSDVRAQTSIGITNYIYGVPPKIGFTMEGSDVIAGGANLTIPIRRYGDSTPPVSATVSIIGGTAVLGTDYTVNKTMPWTASFVGDQIKTVFSLQANPGSAGKTIILQLSNFIDATPNSYLTYRATIIRLPTKPIQQVSPYNMTSTAGMNTAGGITGRVTTFNTTIGIANSDVWIVNASNVSQYFWHTTTNAQGFFQLTNTNNTYVDASWSVNNNGWQPPGYSSAGGYLNLYKAYCNDTTFGDGYSNNFSVEVNSNAWAAIIINPVPAHVDMSSNRSNIVANLSDRALISAYVTDSMGNAVADNTPISFTINPGTTYSLSMGNFTGLAGNTTTVGTTGGYASVIYGGVNGTYAGNNALITASWVVNTNVNATFSLPLLAASSPPSSSHRPIQQVSPYNMTSTAGLNTAGGITGRVTTFNITIGIANTDVWIVNASNNSQYFWHTTTNAQGFFQLTNINNTYVDASWVTNNGWTPPGYVPTTPGYLNLYKAYCNDTTFGEGYSNNFSVESNSNAWAAIIINPIPAHIKIYTERTSIVADGEDKIKVWAYVTDALNNPVADNTPIIFTFSNVTAGGYNGPAGTWIGGSIVYNTSTLGTIGGYANLSYGLIPEGFRGQQLDLNCCLCK